MTSTRADVLRELAIRPDDFVVEVGGGHEPFDRSDIILDKYPFDNLHRSQDLAHRAPVVIADAGRMPLPDQGCDLLFASHIIEHLPRPELFLEEVRRCSRRVYLEFPGINRELMFAWSFHEWLVVAEGTHLVFYRNDIPQLFGDFFHRNYDFLLDAWMERRHREVNAHLSCPSEALTWEFAPCGAFEYAVGRSRRGKQKVNGAPPTPVEYSWFQLGVLGLQRLLPPATLDRLVSAWRRRRRGRPKPLTGALAARLACPHCRAPGLLLEGERLRCAPCGTVFGRRGGLLDLDPWPDPAPVEAEAPEPGALPAGRA